ncbi:hypothetical protein M1O16_04350, partial [Dehalococcoidia bacterium]|nr:hypothetical protein [Dehalococcoidia bacterium]
MSKTRSLKMKGLSLLVALAMAVATLPLVATPALATAEYKMSVVTDPATVAPGETFTATVMIEAPVDLLTAQFEKFTFNHELVEIVSVRGATEAGEPWAGATFMGPGPDEIAEANADGTLDFPTGSFFIPPGGPATPGKFVIIEMRAEADVLGTHTVELAVDEFYALNADLEEIFDADFVGIPGEVVVEGPPPPQPDLVVTHVSTKWVDVGETYTVTFTIKNQGNLDAAASTASIVIDGTEAATADIPALAAGATHEVTTDAFTLTADEDTIKVFADKYDDVTEGNEDNNYKTITILRPMPDLVVTAVSTEWEDVGETYTVTFTIKNEGDAPAAESTASIKIDGVEKATADIPALAAGATHEVTTDAFTLTDDYDTIKVVADSLGVVTEANEGNNSRETIRDALPPQPDLIVSEVDVAWVVVGESYFVEFTIKNQGDATADPSIASIVIDGVEVERVELGRLRADRARRETVGPFDYTLPGDTITVIADKCNLVAEADEENNSVTITRGKVPPPPPPVA